jgi:hypothetical protein
MSKNLNTLSEIFKKNKVIFLKNELERLGSIEALVEYLNMEFVDANVSVYFLNPQEKLEKLISFFSKSYHIKINYDYKKNILVRHLTGSEHLFIETDILVKKELKRIYSEEDPFGEEDWDN